jgi:hypothetical protein
MECLDGATYELKLGDSFGGITFNWHCEVPKEWISIGKFAKYLMELINSIEHEQDE